MKVETHTTLKLSQEEIVEAILKTLRGKSGMPPELDESFVQLKYGDGYDISAQISWVNISEL